MSEDQFNRIARLTAHLPEVEQSKWYGTPALKVRGKGFVRIKDKMTDVLVVMIPIDLKDALMEAEPDKYFETPHYSGWPAMLVNLNALSDDELSNRLECSWLEKAPKKLIDQIFPAK